MRRRHRSRCCGRKPRPRCATCWRWRSATAAPHRAPASTAIEWPARRVRHASCATSLRQRIRSVLRRLRSGVQAAPRHCSDDRRARCGQFYGGRWQRPCCGSHGAQPAHPAGAPDAAPTVVARKPREPREGHCDRPARRSRAHPRLAATHASAAAAHRGHLQLDKPLHRGWRHLVALPGAAAAATTAAATCRRRAAAEQ